MHCYLAYKMSRRLGVALGLTAFILSGCTSMNDKAWADPEFKDWTFKKLAVLGIAESVNLSLQYESLFVENLQNRGSDAVSVHAVAGGQVSDFDDAQLEALLDQCGADALVITRVISEKQRSRYVPVSYGYMPDYYDDYYGYYDHFYDTAHAQVYSFIEYDLEANLYELEGGRLVWSGLKTVQDDRSDRRILKSVMKAIVKEFEKNGYL